MAYYALTNCGLHIIQVHNMHQQTVSPVPTRRIIKSFTLDPVEAEWLAARAAAENRTASNLIETLIIAERKRAEAQAEEVQP